MMRFFPKVGPRTLRALDSARRAPVAEHIAREMHSQRAGAPAPDPAVDHAPVLLNDEQFSLLLRGLYRTGNVLQIPFLVNATEPVRLRPAETRLMVHIQNQSGANQLAIGFGKPPAAPGTIPCDGYIVSANLGWIEPPVAPDGEIWALASGANTPGLMLIALPQ